MVRKAYSRIARQFAQLAELRTLRILAAVLSPQLTLLGRYGFTLLDLLDRERRGRGVRRFGARFCSGRRYRSKS